MTTLDDALDEWITQHPARRHEALARSLGPAAWARARIDRLLTQRPLPGDAWIFLPTLMELSPHATAEERVRLLDRAAVPSHDASMQWLEPLDGALLAAAEAHVRPLTGDRHRDTPPVLVALAAVVARGRLGLPEDPRWTPYLARDFSLYDRFYFVLTRAALRAISAGSRGAIVRAAVARGEPLVLHVLDAVSLDASLFDAAFDLAVRTCPGGDHMATPARGLARCGAAAAPWLLARLSHERATALECAVALHALTAIRCPDAADALVAATGRSSAMVRAAATRALAALGESARPSVTVGAKARKRAVREACAGLLGLLDGDAAAPLRAVRDAHAALDDVARRRIDDAVRGRWTELAALCAEHGAAGAVAAIDAWCDTDPQHDLPRYLVSVGAPDLTWALAWTVATRVAHRRHVSCVAEALSRRDDREPATAALRAAGVTA